ncbi:MAG: hypothetical protein WBF13_05315 [Candidatus Zixiibacteriota bacterium]
MNHPVATQDKKVCRSGCVQKDGRPGDPALRHAQGGERSRTTEGGGPTRQSSSASEDSKHLKLLDTLVDKIIKRLNNNGCSAIIWDDQLLSQDTDINIHNSLQENELEEK